MGLCADRGGVEGRIAEMLNFSSVQSVEACCPVIVKSKKGNYTKNFKSFSGSRLLSYSKT